MDEDFRTISKLYRLCARLLLRVSPLAAAGILLFGGSEPSWSQEKIGAAPIVINLVQGNLPTGNEVPVVQGDSVFLNEAVRSGEDSKAKLVFNDNTNVTVGPGSTLKLDNFVYSGPQSAGNIALNMTKGTLRFVTGDASKRSYTIWTPTAAIGVRGTILKIKYTPGHKDKEGHFIPDKTEVINEEGTAIVCIRKKDEYATVEELRKRCRGREEDQRNLTERKNRSCPCSALLVPNQQATVTSSEIGVTPAPIGAIPEPFIEESFGFGFANPGLVAAGLSLGAVSIGAIAAGVSSTSNETSTP